MSTPASIRVHDDEGQCLVHIYAQYGGYPEDIGLTIAQYLTRITKDSTIDHTLTNGAGDLAAQLVLTLKANALWGGVYMIPASERKQRWMWECRYDIEVTHEARVWVRVKHLQTSRRHLFAGGVPGYTKFCTQAADYAVLREKARKENT